MPMPVMPIETNAPTRPNGESYGVDDRQFWELRSTHIPDTNSTGIRRHVHYEFPKMIYRATDERKHFDSYERKIVGSEQEMVAALADNPGWQLSKTKAHAWLEQSRNDVARAAAETASAAERMSEPAKRAYHRKSAETSSHVTE
jgi:hypothetical protein